MRTFVNGRGWVDPRADEPRVQVAVVATYPPDHDGRFAGCEVWAIDDPAHIESRFRLHRERGAEVRVMQRTWTPSEWEENPDA